MQGVLLTQTHVVFMTGSYLNGRVLGENIVQPSDGYNHGGTSKATKARQGMLMLCYVLLWEQQQYRIT
jgi:hypothetical protein